jgi:flagellar hook-associated protein 2
MATGTISSLGIGTGSLDTASLVEQLMAIERQPITRLDTKEAAFNAQISAFGSVKSRLSTLQSAAATLADPNDLAGFAATVGDSDVLSATAGTFARPGSYTIDVQQLARAQKSFSSLYGAGTSFGAGTLSFTINGSTQDVVLASGGNSLQDVANAVNDAGIGVRATVVTGDAGSRLVLTSRETGTDNAFTLSVSSGDANLSSLASFDAGHVSAVSAQNAIVTVEGETVTSQSNQITSAIANVTITATAVGTSTLDVARDSTGIKDAVQSFVDAYNALRSEISSKTAYDSDSQTAQPLNGDATTRTLLSRLRSTVSTVPSGLAGGDFEYLFSLGVSLQQDGTLSLNTNTLENAINSNFDGVVTALNAYGTAFEDMATAFTEADGLIDNRVNGIETSISSIDDQRERLEQQLTVTEARLRAQFTALDTLMASLSTTSSYLTQQLESLSNLNNSN